MHTLTTETVDLTAYLGGMVQVRWAFASDGSYSAQGGNAVETAGWFVDNIDISDGGGSIFSNDGSVEGDMEAVRLGPGEFGPWEEMAYWVDDEGGQGMYEIIDLSENLIGAPGDTFGIRLRAVYDDVDPTSAFWGFEVSDVLLTVYTRYNKDLSVTWADLGDSTFTKGGFIEVGQPYDIAARMSNMGLSEFLIYGTRAVITDGFGQEVYNRLIYTYAPGQGDTLYRYPDYQDFNDLEDFYDFPDWTPMHEGDYSLAVFVDLFDPDDNVLNDKLVVDFHAYTAQPALFENFNAPLTEVDMYSDGWTFNSAYGDTNFFLGDLFGEGDNEMWWFTVYFAQDSINEMITTPVIDLSTGTGYAARFEQSMYAGGHPGWAFNLKASTDGGSTWSTVRTVQGSSPSGARNGIFNVDLSAVADGQANFQLGFELVFEDTLAEIAPYGYLTIDDLAIYSGADLTPPVAPTGVAATSGDSEVGLTWTLGTGDEMYYSVYAADTNDFASAWYEDDVPAVENSYLVTGLDNDSLYYFFVTATDFNGSEGAESASATATPADTDAPTAIEKLMAKAENDTVVLMWPAPFESFVDTLTTYDIRYSSDMITDANFAAATAIPDSMMIPVGAAGSAEMTEVYLATPAAGSEYYFAIVTTDEKGQASALSNVASTDHTAPAAITDLAVSTSATVASTADDILTLTWTAPGDDADVGTVAGYEVRLTYGDTILVWDNATILNVDVAPTAAGTAQLVDFDPALLPVYPMYAAAFGVVAIDEAGNVSEVSNGVGYTPLVEDLAVNGGKAIPDEYAINQNYPNPFNPT
ncbi:MAG: fibronectin type III domain-containing protein, partial [Candidatus Marinimicrobia bacterium]|nr:fibronectin type III domain-containing protein [Candidatus Neomarinimicrobiota bacterium]